MRNYEQEIETLIKADASVIEMPTFEWERVHEIVSDVAMSMDANWYTWSAVSGISRYDPNTDTFKQVDEGSTNINAAVDWLNKQKENSILIMEDFHQFVDQNSPANVRCLREVMRQDNYAKYHLVKTIILSCPSKTIPEELSKELPVVEVDLPDRDTIEVAAMQAVAKHQDVCVEANITQKVLESALGLTVMEARLAFSKAILQNHKLTEDEIPLIIEEKEQIINKSGLLEYYHPEDHLDNVGGLDNLKDWIQKRGMAYDDDAREFGLNIPRGVLLLGVPGCGKSLTAKAIANEWQMPLLRFDLGKVFGGLVGESERNIRYALDVAETVSPCVLWVDEIEKGLSGSQSSGRSDGGTSSRVMGTFLTWLQEKKSPVFVVATANDVSQLPPELLRKGRLDEIFFVDLPSAPERENIFDIHLKKRGRDPQTLGLNMKELVDLTVNFSGAEIEEAVNEALFNAYASKPAGTNAMEDIEDVDNSSEDPLFGEEDTENKEDTEKKKKARRRRFDLTQKNLVDAITATTPLAQTMSESINNLRRWSRDRARNASKEVPDEVMTIEEAEEVVPQRKYSRYAGMMKNNKVTEEIKTPTEEETKSIEKNEPEEIDTSKGKGLKPGTQGAVA